MLAGQSHPIFYHYIDCFSRRTGHRIRVAKVRDAEFLWLTKQREPPTDKEVYARKEEFLRQLEIQQAAFMRRVHVLHLLHDYPGRWDDVIDPLFVVEVPSQNWQPATIQV